MPEKAQHIRDTLELTTYFIASEIASNLFIEQLRALDKTDILTGVMNRNAMNDRVTALCDRPDALSEKTGVVFADMNGLKYTNDHLGHTAGDQLLKNAAMILKSTFTGAEIYRAGGCLLKPGGDLRDALSEADAQMYRDKGNFYRKYPELKRD